MSEIIPGFREWCQANNLPLPDMNESRPATRRLTGPPNQYCDADRFPYAMSNPIPTFNRSPWVKENIERARGKKRKGAKMQGNPPVDNSKIRHGIEGKPPKGSPKKPSAPGMP